MLNERGQYGSRFVVGAEEPRSTGRSIAPWIIGGVGLAIGLTLVGLHAASRRPRPTPHEKEVSAWEREFPGLPWYMDQVKDARQLDTWERARDHWERTR